MTGHLFETTVQAGVLQATRPQTEWLSTGFNGGRHVADAVYNITVPEGWNETELQAYVDRRLESAGFERSGPALLTGVDQQHARCAVCDPVSVIITAGVSNPTTVPPVAEGSVATENQEEADEPNRADTDGFQPGTINIIAVTSHSLPAGALANLVSVVTEAKTATLLRLTGFSGTTSDAVVVGTDPSGQPATFSGSATAVGRAARACVRDALTASLASRYQDERIPESVKAATYGCETTDRTVLRSL